MTLNSTTEAAPATIDVQALEALKTRAVQQLDTTSKVSEDALTDLDLTAGLAELDAIIADASLSDATPAPVPAPVGPVTLTDDREAFYASIGADDAAKLRAVAIRINASVEATKKTMMDIGRELIAISADIPGHFERWLRLEFDMSKSTAYNYINAVKCFGEVPKVVEILPPATVYKLAAKATPAKVRDTVVREIEAGEAVSVKDVERRIAEAKRQAKEEASAEAERQEQERHNAAAEKRWQAKAKELAEAGKTDKDIERARKTWESAKARRERAKQEKEEGETRRREEYQRVREASEQTARDLVDVLRSNLPADVFETLQNGIRTLHRHSDLTDALKAA